MYLSHKKETGRPLDFSISPYSQNSSKRSLDHLILVSKGLVGVLTSLACNTTLKINCYELKRLLSEVLFIILSAFIPFLIEFTSIKVFIEDICDECFPISVANIHSIILFLNILCSSIESSLIKSFVLSFKT